MVNYSSYSSDKWADMAQRSDRARKEVDASLAAMAQAGITPGPGLRDALLEERAVAIIADVASDYLPASVSSADADTVSRHLVQRARQRLWR
jgi:hypothetical protein